MITHQNHTFPATQVGTPDILRLPGMEGASSQGADYFAWKEWPMRVLGALILVVASPLIVLLIALVRSTSPGPGLYRQERTGKNGQTFTLYKIRSMDINAEQTTGPVWSRPGDSRITPVGKVLRFLHLDELPQLINVVRGEMCLVGPRPERPEIIEQICKDIPTYCERLKVLPGITGLAQLNVPSDVDLESVRDKLVLDLEYIRTASLQHDLKLLIFTALRMLSVRGGNVPRWLNLKRPQASAEHPLYVRDAA